MHAFAQLGDAQLDRFAALALTDRFAVRQDLRFIGGARWFQAALGKFIRHPEPMQIRLGRFLLGLGQKNIADREKSVDLLGDNLGRRSGRMFWSGFCGTDVGAAVRESRLHGLS